MSSAALFTAGLTAAVAAQPGVTERVLDVFPEPIPRTEGVITLRTTEFATLPDSFATNLGENAAPRIQLLVQEPDGATSSERLFVSDQRGVLYTISRDGEQVTPYLDLRSPEWGLDIMRENNNRGFNSFALHPDFHRADAPGYGKLYTLSDNRRPLPEDEDAPALWADTLLLEWSLSDAAAASYDGGAPREVWRTRLHDGMCAFNPWAEAGDADYGLLFVSVSDTVGGAQRLDSPYGKILRINPLASDTNGYAVPEDNPFADETQPERRLRAWAYGFRNASRFGWDAKTGDLFATDVGYGTIESLKRVTPGSNHGWPDWEGSFRLLHESPRKLILDDPRSEPAVTYPVAEFDHRDALWHLERVSITGVAPYRSSTIPELTDRLLFGEIVSGEVFHIPADDWPAGGGQTAIRRVLFSEDGETLLDLIQAKHREQGKEPSVRADLRLARLTDGTLFLLNKRDGVIRQVHSLPSDTTTTTGTSSVRLWILTALVVLGFVAYFVRRRRRALPN